MSVAGAVSANETHLTQVLHAHPQAEFADTSC